MKNILFTLFLTVATGFVSVAQSPPSDSLFLGQTPPGITPVVFNLPEPAGSFTAERIAITANGGEIYYTDIHAYYPTSGDTLRCFRYTTAGWTGPFNVLNSYNSPALTPGDDTLFVQDNNQVYQSFYCTRTGSGWSTPKRLLAGLNSAHYLQKCNSGACYISSVPQPSLGGNDWCRLERNGADTVAKGIGLPVSSSGDNLDFFVARDESFMILAKDGLRVTYPKTGGGWTNPKSLGSSINFGLNMWGPWVTPDHQYLFYTTGTQTNYSDTHIYWVRVDNLIDSLRYTNYTPYLLNKIPDQTVLTGSWFSFTIADTTFVDDDGNQTLTYRARLTNTLPLPSWMAFDSITGTFSGAPPAAGTLNIRVTAVDTAGASVYTTFRFYITDPVAVEEAGMQPATFRLWPNPTRGEVHIEGKEGAEAMLTVLSACGSPVMERSFTRRTTVDLSCLPRGPYLVRLLSATGCQYHRVVVN